MKSNIGNVTLCFRFVNNIHTAVKFEDYVEYEHFVTKPNSENCLDVTFAASLCEKAIIVPDANYIYHICNQKIHVGHAKSLQLPKYRPLNLSPTGLRACKTMWFKLSKN